MKMKFASTFLFRSNCIFGLILCVLSCNKNSDEAQRGKSIFGSYNSNGLVRLDFISASGYSDITLKSDSTYVFSAGSCLWSCVDTGAFTVIKDTLLFHSFLAGKTDTSNHGHHQLHPLPTDKFILRYDKIYFSPLNGFHDTSAIWVRADSLLTH